MGNPDVSGVGKNWYLGSSWTTASSDPTAARKNIDAKLDARFTTFTFQLQNVIDKSLELNETIPNNLDTSFAAANTARINARTAFLAALDDYIPKQTILDDLVASYLPGSPSTSDIAAAKADRDAALTTLKTALAAYETSINNQIVVLKQAADLMQISAAEFVLDLQGAKNDALLFGQSIIDAAKLVDQAMFNAHLIANPSIDGTVTAAIGAEQDKYLTEMKDLLDTSSLSAPIEFNTNISFPDLPKSGRLSQAGMGQLMQFAVNLARMVNEMMEQNRRVDSLINELRLTIYSTAGKNEAAKTALQKAYAEKLQQADTNYNYATANFNATKSKEILELLDAMKDHRTTINGAINDLNDEIDDQNSRGVTTVETLNSAIQIATDQYKVQLWADHSQLDVLLNQLIAQATAGGGAPLTAVSTAAQQVVTDLKTISGLLSVRPINEAAIASVPLAASQTALSNAITALGTPTADVKATLDGFAEFTQIVRNDQTALQAHLASAEAGAAGAFTTQLTAQKTSLENYSADIARVITTLPADDPAIPLLTALKDAVDPVATALNTLLTDLATPPVNLNTIANDQLAITNLLAAVTTARSAINLNDLTGPAEDNVVGVDATINDLEATFAYLTDYTTSTTSIPTPPPGLPGQVKTPLMPAPIQLEHIATIPLSLFNVPPKLPLSNIRPPKDIPELPVDSIDALNKQIDKINQSLAPVLDRLHADGHTEITLLKPLSIRPYIVVRDSSFFIDFTVLDSFFTLLASLINASRSEESLSEDAPNTALFNYRDILGKLNVTAGGTKSSGVGAGVGLEGANLTSSAGSVSLSLSAVLSSTEFSSYVTDLLAKAGVAGGIASLQNLAPVLTAFSQFGVVQPVAAKPATEGLTPEQQLALLTGVKELVATVEDVPQIKSELVALLKGLEATQKLSEEELKVLLSLLLFLLQLLALLVGAGALVGAGVIPSLDGIVEKAFEKPQDKVLVKIVRDLENFGIKDLPQDIGPSNPEFIPTFFNAVVKAVDLPRQAIIIDKITAVFKDSGIEIRTDKPIGTAIREALNEAPTDVAGKIREQLTKLAEEEGTRIREDVLRDATKRPSLSQRIKDFNPQAFAAIPQEQKDTIDNLLNNTAPPVPGLTNEDRNTLVTALIARVITPDQAKGLLQQFTQEQTAVTNPALANLAPELPRVILPAAPPETPKQTPKDVPQLSLKDLLAEEPLGFFAGKPQLSIRQGTPGELPDLVTQVANALKELSKQTSDDKFLQETVTKFAETVREQSDFFQKSLTLLLDPANIYVKNFSIISRQTGDHDGLGPTTQIPIAG